MKLISWTGWSKDDWKDFLKLAAAGIFGAVMFIIIINLFFCSNLAV